MRLIKDNALSLVLLALFVIFWAGQAVAGWYVDNEDRQEHGQPPVEWSAYLGSGHFWEATAENWESEFLQMAAFVVLSASLVQRGSSESKKPDDEEETEKASHRSRDGQKPPWPVRKGGFYLRMYSHSLSFTLGLLFIGSFVIHAVAGQAVENSQLLSHAERPMSFWEFLSSSTFWFQSLQNWQSEFLSVGMLIVLTIFLRERGSPQSKPVDAPHRVTGAS
jgi:hypothetical protein